MRSKRRREEREDKLSFSKLEPRCMLATFTVTTFSDVVADDGLLSLREAITLANSNGQDDTIFLQSGTYELQIAGANEDNNLTGDLDILSDGGHSLNIVGAGQDDTIIDAAQLDRVFNSHIRSSLRLAELTITGGTNSVDPLGLGQRGGGISALATNLELSSVTITGNAAGPRGVGGGLYAGGGTVDISNSELSENTALRTGNAVFIRGADVDLEQLDVVNNGEGFILNGESLAFVDSNVSLSRSRIDNNVSFAAALAVTNSQLDIQRARFFNNGVEGFGTTAIDADNSLVTIDSIRVSQQSVAIAADGSSSQLVVNEGIFLDSRIQFSGSDLSVDNSQFFGLNSGIQAFTTASPTGSNVEISNSEFDGVFRPIDVVADNDILIENIVANISSRGLFPNTIGIRAIGDNVLINNVDLSDTTFGTGIIAEGETLVQIANSRVQASGAIEVAGETQILNTEITDNTASNGGGINWRLRNDGESLTISNSVIARNTANFTSQRQSGGVVTRQNGEGGAIYVDFFGGNDGNINILSSTLVSNVSTNGGVIDSFAGTNDGVPIGHLNLDIHNSIVWNNFSPPPFNGDLLRGNQTLDFTNNIISDATDTRFDPADGNLTANPRFVDFQAGDYRIVGNSPAIDQGDASQLLADTLDLDGDSDVSEPAPDLDLVDRVFGTNPDIGAFEFS